MDKLSLQKVPFFYIIDFLAENIEIFTDKEVSGNSLKIDFQLNTSAQTDHNSQRNFRFNATPPTAKEYRKGFDLIQTHLQAGNSYLANYTCESAVDTDLTPEEIYQLASAKYKIFYPNKFVCFSPETFVEIRDGNIYTHPMKGTIDASVANAANLLKNDPKEKAEHYTVVDLLRNDLSMVADDVRVKDFQRIDLIKTNQKNLYAMSSEISGKLKPEFRGKMGSIMAALLPAGSILGAPKKKTLEIILKAENHDRGYYTGVCGRFDGESLDSCVMIRFIRIENGKLYFKSGGGITHLSKFADEYEEMKNKIYVPIY